MLHGDGAAARRARRRAGAKCSTTPCSMRSRWRDRLPIHEKDPERVLFSCHAHRLNGRHWARDFSCCLPGGLLQSMGPWVKWYCSLGRLSSSHSLPEVGITLIPIRVIGPAGLEEVEPVP